MANANIKYSGDVQDLLREVNKLSSAHARTTKELQTLKRGFVKTSEKGRTGFAKAGRTIRDVAIGLGIATTAAGALRQVLGLVTAEFDNIKRRRIEAATTVGNIARERAIALGNIPQAFRSQAEQLVETAATREQLPLGRAQGFQLIGSLFSATGGLDPKLRAAAFLEASKEASLTGGPQEAFGGAIGDVLTNIPAISKGRTTAQAATAAAGTIEQFGLASRVVERPQQARTLGRLSAAALGGGISEERTFELGAAISRIGGDVEGQTSATAVARLFKNLDIARSKGFNIGGGQRLRISQRGTAGLDEFITKIRGLSPEQQDTLFAGLPLGRGATGLGVKAILTGTEVGRARLAAAEAEITGPEGAFRARQERIGATQAGQFGRFDRVRRGFRAATETLAVGDEERALAGVALEELIPLLRQAGQPALAQKLAELGQTVSGAPLRAALGELRTLRAGVLPRRVHDPPTGGGLGPRLRPRRTHTPGDPETAAALLQAIEGIEQALREIDGAKNDTPQKVNMAGPGSSNAHVEPTPAGGG